MRALSQADCLALWESGQTLHPLDRGLLAVHAGFPECRGESLADWPLGRRNRALARLRCACFGQWLRGWTECEQCAEKLEFEVDGDALAQSPDGDEKRPVAAAGREFRLPTSRDLAQIAGEGDPSRAALLLLEQCLIPGQTPGSAAESPEPRAWLNEDLEAIGDELAAADPLAEILLHFDCPACGCAFDRALDLVSFLWSEIESRARRLLLDVHTLASSYGWSEREILSLSPVRRSLYLEMVRV